MILLGLVHDRYGDLPAVQHTFHGLAAAASALVLANALRIAAPLRTRPAGIAVAVATFHCDRRAAAAVATRAACHGGDFDPAGVALPRVSAVSTLVSLALVFMQLSLLAFGGTNSVLPEMQRQVVQVHPWLTSQEFAALFALAQAAPGPNMVVVTLIGWRVAGLAGALVTTLGVAGPSSVLTFIGYRLWYRFRAATWRRHGAARAGAGDRRAGDGVRGPADPPDLGGVGDSGDHRGGDAAVHVHAAVSHC